MRDSLKQKVYDAEYVWKATTTKDHAAGRTVSMVEAKDIIAQLVKEFATQPVAIRVNGRIKAFGGWYRRYPTPLIEVPRKSLTAKTVLHEFAHHLAKERFKKEWGWRAHGGAFTEAMLDVVEFSLGAEAAKSLQSEYSARSITIGASDEAEKVNKSREALSAANERNYRRSEEEGTVFVIEYDLRGNESLPRYLMGGTRYRSWSTTYKRSAQAFRYQKAAQKRLYWFPKESNARLVEVDGFYDQYEKRWIAS